MAAIQVLDKNTIDKIAAGEVIERPSSIVKELVENSIDANSSAITVEVKDGGTSLIRITDNGSGIKKDEIKKAFLRHSTSKIRSANDLTTLTSLGFRGEALSSISAVSQVELITKTAGELTGSRYIIEGGIEKSLDDIGAPEGTTFIIRNLFFNTPARKKFLKSPSTEVGYISSLMERLALSHPDISFKFMVNNQLKLHTSGNTSQKDIIFNIYGRDITGNILKIEYKSQSIIVGGYIGKPIIARGNRGYENYFINGRYIKNSIISKAIEDAYKPYMMQHKYPFTSVLITIDGRLVDVNVHPSKMEIRFSNGDEIYNIVYKTISSFLTQKELIPEIQFETHKKELRKSREKVSSPEPFEKKRIEQEKNTQEVLKTVNEPVKISREPILEEIKKEWKTIVNSQYIDTARENNNYGQKSIEQITLFNDELLEKKEENKVKIIGQVFDTYWIIQYTDKMLIIDQHAAHEKVLYEQTVKNMKDKTFTSQYLEPPIILTLSAAEENILSKYIKQFQTVGFEIEHFGGKEFAIRAVPDNLFSLSAKDLFIEMLDNISESVHNITSTDIILEKIASMSCKAAVKGNQKLSALELEKLFEKLLSLENPYNCPHGRPTIISMSKYELEKKFKRII